MDAVTYPQASVLSVLTENVIPVRVAYDSKPLSETYNVQWTPTLITLDADGKEHHRTLGFLPAEQFIASVLLGVAKCAFDTGKLDTALSGFEKVLTDYPNSDFAPEAMYLRGVCRYKQSHDPKYLRMAYEDLAARYPGSEWEKRAYPYRLLKAQPATPEARA